ncbi:hypothetical protein ACQP1P_38840 [Dactylosporangium sp. CA-052675]|uniref:hypothetical protein n=1 Tax=Dactylosporangium sp. CA-052675 TaxID=3239927 RepID=UPI003D8C85A5
MHAITEAGRVYYEPSAKAAFDRVSGMRVTEKLRELLNAGWIRVTQPGERTRGESEHLVYYRPTDDFGRAVLKGDR